MAFPGGSNESGAQVEAHHPVALPGENGGERAGAATEIDDPGALLETAKFDTRANQPLVAGVREHVVGLLGRRIPVEEFKLLCLVLPHRCSLTAVQAWPFVGSS